VVIFDILTNETTVYSSIREGARAIECHDSTLSYAMKAFKEKGINRRGAARERSSYLAAFSLVILEHTDLDNLIKCEQK